MVPTSTSVVSRDRMASALASPSLSTGFSHSLSYRADDSDIVPSIQSPSEPQEPHIDDDSEACTAQQDRRRVSLLDRGLEREVVVIQHSSAAGTNDGDSGSEADVKDGSKSLPQSALNRKTRRERAKQNEMLTRQQQLERKARDVQRKKSEQRHLMKGQPFEYRPLDDDSTDATATAKYDRALREQINDLRELARSRQWQKLSVVEQSYSSEEVIAFCKQEIIRLRTIAKDHAQRPQMLAQLQAEFDETQECYAAHVRNLRQNLVSSPTASFNPTALHSEMPALELRWAELAARRADADGALGGHRDLMLSSADDHSGPLAKRKAPLQTKELPPITFVRLPPAVAVTQQAPPQKDSRPGSPQPTQDITGGDTEAVDLNAKQASAKTAKSKRKAEAKKRRKERKRAEQQQQGLPGPSAVEIQEASLGDEQQCPNDAADGGSRVVESQRGEVQAATSAIGSTTAMPVFHAELETEVQEPGPVQDKVDDLTAEADAGAAKQNRQDGQESTTLAAAEKTSADEMEPGADKLHSSVGVEVQTDLIDSSVLPKSKLRTDVLGLAHDLRGSLSLERLRLKAEQRAEPIPSPLTLGPAMVEDRKMDVAAGGCLDMPENSRHSDVDDLGRKVLVEQKQNFQDSGEGSSAPKATDAVQSPSTIFDLQADSLEQAEQARQDTALFDSSGDALSDSDATDSDGAATFIVPDTLSPRQNEQLMIYLRKHRRDSAHEYKSAALRGEVPRLIDLGGGLCIQPLDSNGSGRLVRLVCRSALAAAAPPEQQYSAQTPARQESMQEDEIYIDDGYQASDDSYDSPGDIQSEQSVSSSSSVPQESRLRRRRSLTSSGPASPSKDFSTTPSPERFSVADIGQTAQRLSFEASLEDSSPLQHQQRMLLLAQEQLLHQQRKRLLETGDLYGTDEAGASSTVSRISSPAPDGSGSFHLSTPAVQLARPDQGEAVYDARDDQSDLFVKQEWQRKRVLDKSRQQDVDQHKRTASPTLEVQTRTRKNDGYQLPFQLRRLKMRLARKGITGDTVPSDDDAELEDINRRLQQTQIRRRPLQSTVDGRDRGGSNSARNERRNWQIAEQQSARFWKRANQRSRLHIASNKPARVAERDASRFLGPERDRPLLTSGGAPMNTCFNAAQTTNIGELAKGIGEEAPVKRYSGTHYGKLPRTQVARSLRSRQIGVRLHQKSSSANDSGIVLPRMPKPTSLLEWLSASASGSDTRSLQKTSAAARTSFSQAKFNGNLPLRLFNQGSANPQRVLSSRFAGTVSYTRPQHNANKTRRFTDGASATIVELRDGEEAQNSAMLLLSKGKGRQEDHEEGDASQRGGHLTQDRNMLEQVARSIVSEMDELE